MRIIFILLFSIFCRSQNNICSYHSADTDLDIYKIINGYYADPEVFEAIEFISSQMSLHPNFILVRKDGLNNCAATQLNDIRYILYDPNFLGSFYNKNNLGGLPILFILSHEVGHHLNGHIRKKLNGNDSRNSELQADEFAGYILSRAGGKIEDITTIFELTTSGNLYEYSDSHPSRIDRIKAAQKGFNNASLVIKQPAINPNAIILSANDLAKNIYSQTQRKEAVYNIVDERTINGSSFVEFNKFSSPQNWYVTKYSPLQRSVDNCFIFKSWYEDYHISRAPIPNKSDPLVYSFWNNNLGFCYASFDNVGENVFFFNVWSNNKKDLISRNKKIFKTKVKLKNTDSNIFPDEVWTNKEKDKILFVTYTDSKDYPYKSTFIDLKGYLSTYQCMNTTEKQKYLSPELLISTLKNLESQ